MFKNIPIIKFYIIFISVIYSNIQCSNRIRYATRKDKLVLQNNCYACHAPTVKVEGIAQNQMLPKFGYKGLEKYLQNNLTLQFTNTIGGLTKQVLIYNTKTKISIDELISGIYYYQLRNGQEILSNGKMIVE